MGTPLGPKYIPQRYMDPLGFRVFGLRLSMWEQGTASYCFGVRNLFWEGVLPPTSKTAGIRQA